MPKLKIKRSIHIDASPTGVYQAISNFNHWTAWSPWLIMEPGATVKVSEDASYYEWAGKRVGSGNMTILDRKENEWVDYNLTFLKPWKSTARVKFELTPSGNGTKVDWHMESGLPFFLFWMKKSMDAYVGMDYDRGLLMLKDYVEDGKVHSKLDFKGPEKKEPIQYAGIHRTCSIKNTGACMKEDFGALLDYFKEHQERVAGKAFSIYHKWDMVKDKVDYTSAIPVSSLPEDIPDTIVTGKIPSTEVYTLRHTGPYSHLGNAWATMYTLQRSKEFKVNKKIHPFETYVNMPGEVPENELITDIHFPLK